jgi:hypothetical protein
LIKKYWDKILLILVVAVLIWVAIEQDTMRSVLHRFFSKAYFTSNEMVVDFTNQAGVGKISDGDFPEILIGSAGATKTGEGYRVKLKTINPSFVKLSSQKIIFTWVHNEKSQATTIENPNVAIVPGGHIDTTVFLSPLEGNELKNVSVREGFDLVTPIY